MSIVAMKCVSIFGAVESRDTVLEVLQRLGTLHAMCLTDAEEPPADLTARIEVVRRVLGVLEQRAGETDGAAVEV